MRFIPRSLTGRTVLVLAAAVLLSWMATFWVLRAYRSAVFTSQRAELVASYARAMTAALEALPPGERQALARATAGGGVRLKPAGDEPATGHLPASPRLQALARDIREALGEDTVVELHPGGEPALRVSMKAAGERWWIVLPAPRFDESRHLGWLIALAVIVVIVVSLAWLYVLSIARPLRDLAEAARAIGAGQRRRLEPAGPQELRTLAERFNETVTELEQKERERDAMLAGLPHDLRAPLARLRVRLALLEDEEARAGIARDAEEIERIAAQFLDYLRGNWGEAQTEAAAADFVREAVEPYRKLGRDVSVQARSSPMLRLYPTAMKRVIENLVDNALRHGAEPVEIEVAEDGQGAVMLEVRDHGPGIPEASRAEALEPFSRLDAARSQSGSCGLGLAIVQRVVALHGGSIELDRAPQGGLAVRLRFPGRG